MVFSIASPRFNSIDEFTFYKVFKLIATDIADSTLTLINILVEAGSGELLKENFFHLTFNRR